MKLKPCIILKLFLNFRDFLSLNILIDYILVKEIFVLIFEIIVMITQVIK